MSTLNAEGFTLEVNFIYYKKEITDINYINYYFAKIAVNSFDYSGKTEFVVSEEECANFVKRLTEMFESLNEGEVGLTDYEPDENNLYFNSDGFGYFIISGVFNNWGDWTLKFSKRVDQTYLKGFILQLNRELTELDKIN